MKSVCKFTAPRLRLSLIKLFTLFCCAWMLPALAEPLTLKVDFAQTNGVIRALHGVNKGPLGPGSLMDLTAEHRAIGVPHTRLHDCYFPNPYVVDIHAVFPDFNADPAKPESYDFRLTDEYLAAVRASGAQIVYRLGESIEHTSVKRFVHPPTDTEKWAAICLGIIRHYNEGWVNGHRYDIRYWEIWNEPENRPAMWSGTDEDYFQLYRVTAKTIRKAYPNLKIGGPAVGASGRFVNGKFQPTEFVNNLLKLCRAESLPMDFFSWHCYTDNPNELVLRTQAIRELLDRHGFTKTENHLNEWNYLPGNSWAPLERQSPAPARQRYYEAMAGVPGAAFIASALIELQDAPLDVGNLFHGEVGAFGIFNEFGVPQKNYYALLAFQKLVETSQRVTTTGSKPGQLALAAGLNAERDEATVLVSNYAADSDEVRLDLSHLPWPEATKVELRLVNETNKLGIVHTETISAENPQFTFRLPNPAIALIQLRPAKASAQLKLTSPANRLVFQRDQKNQAYLPIAGTIATPNAVIEARLVPAGQAATTESWQPIATAKPDGSFSGKLLAQGGWYTLEVRALSNTRTIAETYVSRVGIGEVFVVVGHSVAQGGELNLPGSMDERVNTVALETAHPDRQQNYERTADPQYLPALTGSVFSDGTRPAPFGHGTYFWARFSELLAQKENVPVMIFNAGFGGTSLQHWAKSARGELFEHSFVRAPIRMPYINLHNTLKHYLTVTGVRAILSDQGQNDSNDPTADTIFNNSRTWIEQARTDLGYPQLAIVVNRQTPYPQRTVIRQAQEQIIREIPHCYPGPDYDTLAEADRPDRIHLGESGAIRAAQLWANALDKKFFQQAIPYLPK